MEWKRWWLLPCISACLIAGPVGGSACGKDVGPAQTAHATDAGRPIVIGRSFSIASRILGSSRTLNVYLPEGYGDAKRRFPVLVLLDGGEDEDFLHISGLAQFAGAYGRGEQLIVVGVAGADRRHDLTSPSAVSSDLKVAPTSDGADAYRRFLVEELQPWVAARYRTSGRVGLMGESLAGRFVLETLLERPEAFTDYVAVSPSLWWNGGRLVADAAAYLQRGGFGGRRLSLTFETPEPPADAAARETAQQHRLVDAFRSMRPNGLDWDAVRLPEKHADVYHAAALRSVRRLFGRSRTAD